MKSRPNTASRRVSPRKWALLTATSLVAATPAILPIVSVSPVHAATSEAGEGGEAGEGRVVLGEGPAAFLTSLGFFEGTYRIVATLYLNEDHDLARQHQDESHHAYYDDIEAALATYGAPGFAEQAERFTAAIKADASNEEVREALVALLTALRTAEAAAKASPWEQLMSIHDLMALSAAEYDGGVENGKVGLAIEYRDSWGFYATALARAQTLSEAADPVLAKAGRDVLDKLDGADALFPGLTADTASTDPSQLAAAAGWAEIFALRTK